MNSKNAFWQALVFTAIVFFLGIALGFFLENKQSGELFNRLVDSEINILDDQLRERIISDFEFDCSLAKESLFNFADKIYEEAGQLEEEDSPGRLNDLAILHKRYDLLRTMLWVESTQLMEKCRVDFHVLVYLYEYKNEDIDVASKQFYYSRMLFDLKSAYPDKVILIPIAVDTGVSSLELMLKSRELNVFPVIVINDKKTVMEIITLGDFEDLVFSN